MPDCFVIVRGAGFLKMRPEGGYKTPHGIICGARPRNAVQESRGVPQLPRPGQDCLVRSLDLVRCLRKGNREFVSAAQKLQFACNLCDLAHDIAENSIWRR